MRFSFPDPARLLFWTGAGISAPPPSRLPLGDELTRSVIDHGCGVAARKELFSLMGEVAMVDASGRVKRLPRLEAVLQPLIGVLGEELALAPFQVLAAGVPNVLHHLFASHLRQGGAHVTMNLDRCIEKAAEAESLEGMTHLHGTYRAGELARMSVELGQVGRGLDAEQMDTIKTKLGRASELVVCGYSGRDYFDVDPFFAELRSSGFDCANLRVLWIEHHSSDRGELDWSTRGVDGQPILAALASMGAEVSYRRGPTGEILNRRFGPGSRPKTRSGRPRPPAPAPVPWPASGYAAAHVFLLLGAAKQAQRLSRRLLFDGDHSREARARRRALGRAASSGRGNYRRAVWSAWRLPHQSPSERAHRLRLVATDLRLRGQLAAGGFLHAKAILAYESAGGLAAWERHQQCDAIVEWLFWQREVLSRRKRWTQAAVERALAWAYGGCDDALQRLFDLDTLWTEVAEDSAYIATHPHAVAQLARLRLDLPRLRSLEFPHRLAHRALVWESNYAESDSIAGYINRAREKMSGADPTATQESVRHLRRMSALIGDRPGMLKADLIARSRFGARRASLATLAWIGWSYPLKARWVWRWLRRREWRTA